MPLITTLAGASAKGYGGLLTFGGGGAFESIATLAGTGSSSTITFSSIPSTYQHLQIRYIARVTAGGTGGSNMGIRINGITTTSYAYHSLEGNGATAYARGAASQTYGEVTGSNANDYPTGSDTANVMGIGIIDILDYASTTKNKTIRALGGYDLNGSGGIGLGSTLFNSTAAVTSISLLDNNGLLYTTTSSFALYGIKGA